MNVLDHMDRSKTNYWPQQQADVNQTTKHQAKVDVNFNGSKCSHSVDNCLSLNDLDVLYYGDNNQVKRRLSGSDQRGSPFKKRQFSQETIAPVQTGLFIFRE